MTAPNRPLSPHLDIYKLPLTAILSISHRITGVFLSLGTLLLACWITAAATSPEAYNNVNGFIGSWFGQLLLFGWSFAFFFHLCNGIRHLFWDIGVGFDKEIVDKTSMIVLIAAAVMTVLTWLAALMGGAS